MPALTPPTDDAYVGYIRRFFLAWLPYYDLFAWSIRPIYASAARRVGARSGLSVLDICTGTGEMALRCARAGASVTAVDLTEVMLDKARRKAGRLPIRFESMDARHLDFPDDSFDVSVLSLALHDMPRKVRLEVLRQAVRVTRSRIVILEYDFPRQRRLRGALIRFVNLFETAYFKRFAEEGALPLLAEAGLQDVEVSRAGPPFFSVFVVSLLNRAER